ncbi:hypothetical protein, partial [Campylobacter magnus]
NFKFFDGSYVALPLLEKEFNEYKKSGGIIGLEEAKKNRRVQAKKWSNFTNILASLLFGWTL